MTSLDKTSLVLALDTHLHTDINPAGQLPVVMSHKEISPKVILYSRMAKKSVVTLRPVHVAILVSLELEWLVEEIQQQKPTYLARSSLLFYFHISHYHNFLLNATASARWTWRIPIGLH